MEANIMNRRLYVLSAENRIVLVSANVEIGDHLTILRGVQVLMVLREMPKGSVEDGKVHEIICDACVSRLVLGEAT